MGVNVTRSFLPPLEEYVEYLRSIWDSAWLTNNGPLVMELERKLREYLGVKHALFCGNGTITIQIALKALNITQEVITTPFSYVATTSSLLWEHCTPVFVDIAEDCNIDPDKIEQAITPRTQAILAVHVYGNPCAVGKIETIAQKHGLKVIYDGAHAFGAKLNGTQVLSFGDISTCSFHATKLFHTVEGGALLTNNDELAEAIFNYRSFGHRGDDYYSIGINGKNSEFHAAMGLSNFPYLNEVIGRRRELSNFYDDRLKNASLRLPVAAAGVERNYAYYPVIFESEEVLLKVKRALESEEIFSRRYFYPSLNEPPYVPYTSCPVSEDISRRVLALPFFPDLEAVIADKICKIILDNAR